jgi:hypothetical protein
VKITGVPNGSNMVTVVVRGSTAPVVDEAERCVSEFGFEIEIFYDLLLLLLLLLLLSIMMMLMMLLLLLLFAFVFFSCGHLSAGLIS